MDKLQLLIEILAEIEEGRYPDEISELTGEDTEEPVRSIARAVRRMMEKVGAREQHLAALASQGEEAGRVARNNVIATVTTMAKALAARDSYTIGHAERVGLISGLLAVDIGLGEEEVKLIQVAGLLHDIGKIGFPDALFLPHEGSNPEEIVREITRHPITGAEILKDLDFLGKALPYIRCHHERPDGQGYPNRLKDPDIPLGAKIIAAADGFDAMTTDRPYQKGKSFNDAISILKEGAGTRWDPACVAAFERILPKIPVEKTGKTPSERLQCFTDDKSEIVLTPGPSGGARLRWIRPGIDFTRFKGLMFDRVIFFFAPDSEYKGMEPLELKELADLFHRQIRNALRKNYPLFNKPGPGTARVRFAITDLKQSRPVLCDLWPAGFDTANLKKGLKTSWAGSGATSVEVIVLNSMTNIPIMAAIDDQKIGIREKFTKWGSAEDAFRFWAARIKWFLDQINQGKDVF